VHQKIYKPAQVGVEVQAVPVADVISQNYEVSARQLFAILVKGYPVPELKENPEDKLKQKIIYEYAQRIKQQG
jgi:hypothetical protein